MAKNQTISQLDSGQLVKRVYDEANDAIRVEIGTGSSFAIGISADSGDSVVTVPTVTEVKASLANASTGTGTVVIPATTCIGMKSFNLYTNTLTDITGAQVCTLQVSPSDSDNVWISTSLTITPSATTGTVVMGTVATGIVARRFRVIIAAAITTGTFNLYALGQSV